MRFSSTVFAVFTKGHAQFQPCLKVFSSILTNNIGTKTKRKTCHRNKAPIYHEKLPIAIMHILLAEGSTTQHKNREGKIISYRRFIPSSAIDSALLCNAHRRYI